MHIPSIRGIIRRNLLLVFLIALLAGGGGVYVLLEREAMANAEQEAHMMLSAAMAVRTYSNTHILPHMLAMPDQLFHEETVPSFAAQTVFRSVNADNRAYTYREAALNPTAPADRAGPLEVDLIRQFREDPALKETRGTIDDATQRQFYLARPIKIVDPACIICHDTPARAPKAMIAKYGPNNGFGWHLGEIVGVQILTVPVTHRFHGTVQLIAILIAGLAVIFGVAYFALSAALDASVITPLSRLAEAAEQASRSTASTPALPATGAHEIRALSEAIQRLRISLAKALARLAKDASDA